MLHKEIWGLTILGFILWIFFTSNPLTRIDRACSPINWAGNVTVSLTALTVPKYQDDMQKWFTKFDYGCQYTIWRLFYQKEYNAAMGIKPEDKLLSEKTKAGTKTSVDEIKKADDIANGNPNSEIPPADLKSNK